MVCVGRGLSAEEICPDELVSKILARLQPYRSASRSSASFVGPKGIDHRVGHARSAGRRAELTALCAGVLRTKVLYRDIDGRCKCAGGRLRYMIPNGVDDTRESYQRVILGVQRSLWLLPLPTSNGEGSPGDQLTHRGVAISGFRWP